MYNNISRKQRVVNGPFKSLSGDISNPVIKFPVILPPINTEFANNFISRPTRNIVDYKYEQTSNRANRSSDFISPDILSKYPCLNPMYKFNYKLSKQFLNDIYTDDDSDRALGDYSGVDSDDEIDEELDDELDDEIDEELDDEIDEELEFHYEQRNWTKMKSNTLSKNQHNIILMKGDVVNIDKKTLVFDKFNYKTCRHIFKELTSLKIYDYDLNIREYTVVIPSQLKSDIIHAPALHKSPICSEHIIVKKELVDEEPADEELVNEKPVDEELVEGYLSDLENGTCSPAILGITSDVGSSPVENDILGSQSIPIIIDYVSSCKTIDNIYNITKNTTIPIPPTVDFPRVVGHNDDSYNGTYFMSSSYGDVNGWPVFSTDNIGNAQRFIFRFPVKFTKSGFVWVLQPFPPGTMEWNANAYGYGNSDPWLADWGNITVVNARSRRCIKVIEPPTKQFTNDDADDTNNGGDKDTDDTNDGGDKDTDIDAIDETDEVPASNWCVIS